MAEPVPLRVEVVYAEPDRQWRHELQLAAGSTIRQAVEAAIASGALPRVGDEVACGVFGRRVPLDAVLADGDRVEIYRPLALDPKEARRRRAKEA